jgi:hypothetical protein
MDYGSHKAGLAPVPLPTSAEATAKLCFVQVMLRLCGPVAYLHESGSGRRPPGEHDRVAEAIQARSHPSNLTRFGAVFEWGP